MTRTARSFSSSFTAPVCLALSYMLLLSLCAPFTVRQAEAAPAKASTAPTSSAAAPVKKDKWRDGELIVRFRHDLSEQDKDAFAAVKRGRRIKKLRGGSRLEKLRLAAGDDPQAVAAELRLDPRVELAEPNYLISRDETVPNDPQFGEQWALRNTGQNSGEVGADINASVAWGVTTGSTNTIIAVIDSGIDFRHPDLLNNQWTNTAEQANGVDDDQNGLIDDLHGWDWVADSNQIKDEQGHGTAIAGLIAAEGNNGVGTSGVMWRASLMSLRVLDSTGTGTTADAVEAIDYAIAHGAKVINCSWGTEAASLILRDAIQRAAAQEVLVVCSAGNSGREIDDSAPYYPASFDLPNVVVVAATNHLNQLISSSNRGAAHVAVAAPGADVLTTQMGGGYRLVTGTSASTALVSGVAGLMRTVRPLLGAADTKAALVNGSRQVADLAGKVSSGGVVSASGALGVMQGPDVQPSPMPTPTPTPTPTPEASPTPSPTPSSEGGGGDPGGSGGESGDTDPPGEPGAPGGDLPNLADERNEEAVEPQAPEVIHADLCGTCAGNEDPPPGQTPNDPDMSTARVEPRNKTGKRHVDLGSRNFNWSLPIVNLPGRAGMDLNLTMFYNSLVWTKEYMMVRYNADRGFPGPGFRLGLPTIQQRYKNTQGNYAYLLVTPTGGRVEMQQVGTTSTYESLDGSYMQMTDNGAAGAVVRTTDGTQMTFVRSLNVSGTSYIVPDGEMRCTEIKDHNGNYISASYDSVSRLSTITDTLGRTVTFTYNSTGNLLYIRQQLESGTLRTLATFTYNSITMQTDFRDAATGEILYVEGPQNGTMINVPVQVQLVDGTRYNFAYTQWGQVWKISRSTPDSDPTTSAYVVRSYITYNLTGSDLNPSSTQSDCPRFTEERVWAENWNGDTGDGVATASEEAVTTYSVAADDSWTQVYFPDNTSYKELFATSGWEKGLTTGAEYYLGSTKKKWTTTLWTQDDEALSYKKNPRVKEANIYDEAGNRRRTSVIYTTFSLPSGTSCSLPMDIKEYDSNAVTVLRTIHTDYNLNAAYTTRRVIGLVSRTILYKGDTTGTVAAKTDYQYDETGMLVNETGQTNAVQHDATYGTSFNLGRGNQTSVIRYDVQGTQTLESNTKYNANGSVVSMSDPLLHKTSVSYKDQYFTGNATAPSDKNTWAYPTKITDPDGYSSTAEYDFDNSVPEKTTTPSGGTGSSVTTVQMLMTYDSAGRMTKATNLENNAYTRWVYDPSLLVVKSYRTVIGTGTANEVYSLQMFDGAGRVRGVSSDHPDSAGTAGRYRGQYFFYDVMGRPWKQSNPTEIDVNWVATGDDAAGWRYTTQQYDWKGRPTTTIYPDGSKTTLAYDGCGCAGGEVTTFTDQRGRQRVLTKDAVGRLKQVDEMNFDATVYATTIYTYDVLNHLLTATQGSGTSARKRTFTYDGYGRLSTRGTGEQGTTTYTYNTDDTLNVVRDARGTTATFAYNNNRGLASGITYGETTGVAATPDVTFSYDAVGHRTSMTETLNGQQVGKSVYNYNDLGQLFSEERTLNAVSGSPFTLSYTYNLSGELTTMTSSLGPQVSYAYDKAGRTTQVTGAGWAGISNYVESVEYRAFNGVKTISYSNTKTLAVTYDTNLRTRQWNVAGVLGWVYSYQYFGEKTGRVTYADSLNDTTQDRSYEYDQVGRLVRSETGSDARYHIGLTTTPGTGDGSYSQTYSYDQWGNMTSNLGRGGEDYVPYAGLSFTIKNQRVGYSYDKAGNLTSDGIWIYTYDAVGQQATAKLAGVVKLTQSYDGDGLRVKKEEEGAVTYYLRSSVLGGQVVAELDQSGVMQRGYVYLGGQLLALQDKDGAGAQQVSWVHADPVTKSQRFTSSTGAVLANRVDVDPWGVETSRSVSSEMQPHRYTSYERDANGTDEAMFRRYNSGRNRFDQPDPYDGSYDLSDPQSFNRYAYVENDPVNLIDPTGLESPPCNPTEPGCLPPQAFYDFLNYVNPGPEVVPGHGDPQPKGLRQGKSPQNSRSQRSNTTGDSERKKKLEDCKKEAEQIRSEAFAKQQTYRDILPTRDDIGLGAATGGLTTAYKLYTGARVAAALGAGIESFGLGLAAIPLYRLGKIGITNAIEGDKINDRFKQSLHDCYEKYGP